MQALPSPVATKLETSGGERVGVIRLTSFNARAQVGCCWRSLRWRVEAVGWSLRTAVTGEGCCSMLPLHWRMEGRHAAAAAPSSSPPTDCSRLISSLSPASCLPHLSALQRDTLAAVQQLQEAGASRLVLDLRDNRGGLVNEGIEVGGWVDGSLGHHC